MRCDTQNVESYDILTTKCCNIMSNKTIYFILFSLMGIASLALTSCDDDGIRWEPYMEYDRYIYMVYNNLDTSEYNAAVHVERTILNTYTNETTTSSFDDTFDTTNETTLLLPTLELYTNYMETIKENVVFTYRITIDTGSGEAQTDTLKIVFNSFFEEKQIYFNGEERDYDHQIYDTSTGYRHHRYFFVEERKQQ